MKNLIQSLEPVNISLIISRWNEGSVLRLYEDEFEESTHLVLLEELGCSVHCNGKSLDNQPGSVQNDRRVDLDTLLWFLYWLSLRCLKF